MTLNEFINDGRLRKIKIDLPSACNAKCRGCYTFSAIKDSTRRIPVDKVKQVLDSAAEFGFWQLTIAADGEPFMDKRYLYEILEHASGILIENIVYTNGSLITRQDSQRLYGLDVSLLLKRNSMDHDKQNKLLRADLSESMMRGLQYLVDAGFRGNRLALQSHVSRETVDELPDVLRYCRENDLMPYFEEFIPTVPAMALEPDELMAAFERYQQIDMDEFRIDTPLFQGSRKYGIERCAFDKLVSIDVEGYVRKCIVGPVCGNILIEGLDRIYERMPNGCGGCSNIVRDVNPGS